MSEILTAEQLAAYFDVSRATIRDWIFRGLPVLKVGRRGKGYQIDLDRAKEWFANRSKVTANFFGQEVDFSNIAEEVEEFKRKSSFWNGKNRKRGLPVT